MTVLDVARTFIGIKEVPSKSNKTILGERYGQNGVAWCGIAVNEAFRGMGINTRQVLTNNMASTVAIMSAGKKKGWFKPARQAQPGDIVCMHMPGGRKGVNHVGLVESVTATGCWTLEGNTSLAGSQFAGGAYLRKFRPWSVILGVVRVPGAMSGAQPPSVPRTAPTRPPEPTTAAEDFRKLLETIVFFSKVEISRRPLGLNDDRVQIVKMVQNRLIESVHAQILPDGIYGPETIRWVQWYQGTHGLPVLGWVDTATINSMFP